MNHCPGAARHGATGWENPLRIVHGPLLNVRFRRCNTGNDLPHAEEESRLRSRLRLPGGAADHHARRCREGPPNVVFILADDLDTADLHRFPNISKLASSGTTFSHFYVTNPWCCPSRSSILRSQYIHSHGVTSNRARLGRVPEVQAAGGEHARHLDEGRGLPHRAVRQVPERVSGRRGAAHLHPAGLGRVGGPGHQPSTANTATPSTTTASSSSAASSPRTT